MATGTIKKPTRQIEHVDVSVKAEIPTTNGLTIDVSSYFSGKLLAAVLVYAWPASVWTNGAVVAINRIGASDVSLTTNYAQTYGITLRLFYEPLT